MATKQEKIGPVTINPEGRMSLYVNISVPAEEIRIWSADRIAAFFDGISRVVATRHAADLLAESRCMIDRLEHERRDIERQLSRAEAIAARARSEQREGEEEG